MKCIFNRANRFAPLLPDLPVRVAVALLAMLAMGVPAGAVDYYWDLNGTDAGASGGTTATGTWNASNEFWNTDFTGGAGGTISVWQPGGVAVFSAGSNATGTSTVTVSGTHQIGGLLFEEGTVTLSGSGTLQFSGGTTFTHNSTAGDCPIDSAVRGNGTLILANAGALNSSTPVAVSFNSNGNTKTLRLGNPKPSSVLLLLGVGMGLLVTRRRRCQKIPFVVGDYTPNAPGLVGNLTNPVPACYHAGVCRSTLVLGVPQGSERLSARKVMSRHIIASLALVGLLTVPVFATDYTWKGTSSSDWSTSDNWQEGVVPPSSGEHRISVYNAGGSELIYTAAQGTTTYTGSSSSRALLIGNMSWSGSMKITGGEFISKATASDGIAANNASGTLTIDGGSYQNDVGTFDVGFSGTGTGTLTIKSGSFTVGTLQFGEGSGTGILNLDGGFLAANLVKKNGATSTFNFNGGTLVARASSATFMTGLNYAYVKSLGAVIDTDGYSITIGQALLDGGGGGGLRKIGTGTLTLTNGSSTYTGPVLISKGALNIRNAGALGDASGVTVANGGQLELQGGITVSGKSVTLDGGGANLRGAMQSVGATDNTWDGDIALATSGSAEARLGTTAGTAVLRVTGAISGGTAYGLGIRTDDDSKGKVVLSGVSTYAGPTWVVTGTLQLAGGDNRLPTGTVLKIGNAPGYGSSTFDLNGCSQEVAGLTDAGMTNDRTVTNSSGAAATLTVNNAASNTFAGVLQDGATGTLALTKTGVGTLTLTGANTYTGPTAVDAGLLLVHGTHVGGGAYTVQNSGTLGGTGTVGATVGIGNGGTLAPGASIGTLAIDGNLAMADGSTFEWEFNSSTLSADLLNLDGNLNLDLAGGVSLDLVDLATVGGEMELGTKFTLISYSGDWNGGLFEDYANLSKFESGANQWRIRYDDAMPGLNLGEFGSFVTLTVVPEPSSVLLLLGVGLGLLVSRRRRG